MSITIDSGACDSVTSSEPVPDNAARGSVEFGRGEHFQSVSGEPIPNLGDLRLPLYMREDTVRGMVMKAAPVKKPLGSVKKICQAAGHMVVFDDKGSLIMIKSTGEVNCLREEDGNYMLSRGTTSTARIQKKRKFSRTTVTNNIGVRPSRRHNRVGDVGEEESKGRKTWHPEQGRQGEPLISSSPQENARLQVARDPRDPSTKWREDHNATTDPCVHGVHSG